MPPVRARRGCPPTPGSPGLSSWPPKPAAAPAPPSVSPPGWGPRRAAGNARPTPPRDSIVGAGGKVPEAQPRAAGPTYERRSSDWQHKWYWGGQGGLMVFRTNYDSYSFEPTFGGHWLITGKRTALYAAYEQSFFLSARHVTFIEPSGTVTPGNVQFNNLRRVMVGVLAFPAQLRVESVAGR